MAHLNFCDTHNQVAYLQKSEGSEGFHQIIDFLTASHIKYVLIENPKIYVSLIQQFWGTTTTRTTDDGEVEITVRLYGKVKTITEASLRRHFKLEDSDGITSLPNTKIFEQLALMGYVSDSDRLTFQKGYFPLSGGQGSGTIHKTHTRPHDSPLLRVHTLGSDEGSMQQNELTDLVTKLTDKVKVLDNDLEQIKKVYSSALTKLILRVKRLERKFKTNKDRRRARIVISEDEDAKEDSSKQGRKISEIDKDPTISLVQPEQDMEYDFDISTIEGFTTASVPVTTVELLVSTAGAEVTTASAFISTVSLPRVSTAEDISGAETLVYIRRSASKDKGKGIVTEPKPEQTTTKLQQRQERAGFEAAIRLQEQFDEEERQRNLRIIVMPEGKLGITEIPLPNPPTAEIPHA
ncbi:hypothetical protein Tco_0418638 [Tanacetum coccineum]